MNSNTRLIVNTLAQNVRTIINIVLSLYTTRIAMKALGVSDYGIYMLVAGIVSLLSYVSNTLIVTTQRFLSYAAGAADREEARNVFANSYLIHCFLGVALAVIFISLTPWIFGHLINIPPEKTEEARIAYYLVTATVIITFITSPFRALLISHENIVYISIVDVLDGVLKLGLIFTLFLVDTWRLPLYALLITCVMLFNFIMLAGYSHFHYEECCLIPRLKSWNKAICRKLVGFATWTIYGMACIYTRSQGVAVILNRAFGTLANAAYGIAVQVYGSIQFLSSAIRNAIAPQIIKAEGEGNRPKAIHLTLIASKYSFLLLSLASVPLIAEMPILLRLWLHDVPENAVFFCRMMLIASLCDQATVSLGILNQAIGRIRNYTLVTFTVKVLCLPVGVLCLHLGMGISSIMVACILFEFISAIIRLPFLMRTAGLKLHDFVKGVLFPLTVPTLAMLFSAWTVCALVPPASWRFLLTGLISTAFGLSAIWLFAMAPSEQQHIRSLIIKRIRHDKY